MKRFNFKAVIDRIEGTQFGAVLAGGQTAAGAGADDIMNSIKVQSLSAAAARPGRGPPGWGLKIQINIKQGGGGYLAGTGHRLISYL